MDRTGKNRSTGQWRSRVVTFLLCSVVVSTGLVADPTDPPSPVDFGRDVRPILSQSCFPCHGPNEESRKAGLRLDHPAGAYSDLGGYAAIVPGEPGESELLHRVRHPSERMPPEGEREALSREQIDVIHRWIDEGANYQEHWSFLPIQEQREPDVALVDWPSNSIDHFVLRRLEREGLGPSPEADRRTLIRRLSFDLTGMPPTPEEVDDFLADTQPDAYESLVDRLLSSKSYAERMTLAWMDAARYGDTSVFHADGPRDMWPWRDWVINAYHGNMPFDQFVLEQIAGDLIPDATRSQRIGSGFLRNNGSSDEGGAIDEEFRVRYMVDRVKTTGNVLLGLSLECAQCHEHKFDPISQKDYYRFYAFFNQSVEKGMQSRSGNEVPIERIPDPEQDREDVRLLDAVAKAEARVNEAVSPQGEYAIWEDGQRAALLNISPPVLGPWFAMGPFTRGSQKEAFETRFGPEQGVDLSAMIGDLTWAERDDWPDATAHSLGLPNFSAMYLYRTITVDRPMQRAVSLGSDDTIQVWLNGKSVLAKEVGRGVAPDQDRVSLELVEGENHFLFKICNGGGASGFYFKILGLPLSDALIATLQKEPGDRTEAEQKALRDYHSREVWEEGKEMVSTLASLRAEHEALREQIPTVMVMQDLDGGRMTYLLNRGQYDQPAEGEVLEPTVLEFLSPLPEGAPKNRLGLARWLVDPEHPLTARVAVNRYWGMLFGTGIVKTVMDFGSQGDWPSHPELLDWLARDFIEHGWNVKRTIKQMVMSQTYRQLSTNRPDLTQIDVDNRFLWRAPRYRLQGEFLRDQALSVSGLLVDRVGGPGVRTYQPSGLWNEVSLDKNVRFTQDHGEDLYRKSMYIYWKRSAPMPAMIAFDAPTREKCVVQRQKTNTPLQALVTLNDIQFVEAARHLASRMMKGGEGFSTRLDIGFELCTVRPADEIRRQVMEDVFTEQLSNYRNEPASAEALLSVGESERDTTLDVAEHAAWTVVASMLLNLDETLNRE